MVNRKWEFSRKKMGKERLPRDGRLRNFGVKRGSLKIDQLFKNKKLQNLSG